MPGRWPKGIGCPDTIDVVDEAAERRMQACNHYEYQQSIIVIPSDVQAQWGRSFLASLNSV